MKTFFIPEAARSMNLAVLAAISFYSFFSTMSLTVVFAFAPQLVKEYGASEVETGHRVGIFASSYYLGLFISAIVWGYAADTFGKKRTAVVSGCFLVTTTLVFGVSRSFYWATISRFAQGLANGSSVIVRTLMVDVCDAAAVNIGMSVLLTSVSLGYVMGTGIGGCLAFPHLSYPNVISEDNLFAKYGILLPNLVIAVGVAVGILLVGITVQSDDRNYNEDEDTQLLPVDKTSSAQSGENESRSKVIQVLKTKHCLNISAIECLLAFSRVGYIELFALVAATKQAYGGLGRTTPQIGIIMIVEALCCLPLQPTILPKLNDKLGSRNALIMSCTIMAITCPLLPAVCLLKTHLNVAIVLAAVFLFLRRTFIHTAFVSVNVTINSGLVAPDLLGTLNGITFMFRCAGYLLAPIVLGSLYSWSLTNVTVEENKLPLGFPFDAFFAFFVMSLVLFGVVVMLTIRYPDYRPYTKSIQTQTPSVNSQTDQG